MNNSAKNHQRPAHKEISEKTNKAEEMQVQTESPERALLKVGITHGDTNGVGYELILKTFAENMMFEICTPVVYGSAKIAATHRKGLELNTNFRNITSAEQAEPGCLNLIDCVNGETKVEWGKTDNEAGSAALQALECAVKDLKAGKIDVLVTAPICKSAIQSDDFHFAGHTEFLADRLGNEGEKPLMILANQLMRVALVTTHLPLSGVAAAITQERVGEKIRSFYHSLRRDFLLSAPRLAVLGLNPHNGDEGVVGEEENLHIIPAIQAAQEEGIPCFGPYSADGFFGSALYEHFDGVLAMYHDQGLAAFKALSMEDGVNFTSGLSYVRTSPDHGTAFDIAGKGVASENSFRQAIYMAVDIFHHRKADDEAHVNPLPKLYHERREDSERQRHTTTPKAAENNETEQNNTTNNE